MRIGEIGGRFYAMELVWSRLDGATPQQHAKEVAGVEGKTFFTAIANSSGELVCGTGQLEDGEKPPRRPVYSYVAALAKTGQDAIYVGPVEDRDGSAQLWYAVIHDGAVSPGTDISDQAEKVISSVYGMSAALDLPILVMGEIAGFEDSKSFDPVEIVADVKTKPLQVAISGIPKIKIAAVLASLLLVAGGGYHVYAKAKQQKAAEAAVLAELQAQEAYVSQIRMVADQLPATSAWSVRALTEGLSRFPPWYAGWMLSSFTCKPRLCEADYKPSSDGFTYHAMSERFGADRVVWRDQDRTMVVSFDLGSSAELQQWTGEAILNPPREKSPAMVPVGLLPRRVPGVGASEKSLNLSAQLAGPGSALPLWQDEIETTGSFYLDSAVLNTLASIMASTRFVATEVVVKRGSDSFAPSWTVKWTRLRGDISSE